MKNYIIPQFGKGRLSDLNPVQIENWLVGLSLGNGTKNDILYTLNIVLTEAKREKLLEIWNELKYASMFHTMATTGIRSGDAMALQWQDVSWDLKGLPILRAVKADGSIGQSKAKEIRRVYLSDQGHRLLSD